MKSVTARGVGSMSAEPTGFEKHNWVVWGDLMRKHALCTQVVALVLMINLSVAAHATPGRHALLIGISKYDRGRKNDLDWWDLHAFRDVKAVETEIKKDYGYTDGDVKKLTARDETTHRAIRQAFEELIAKTNQGDIVYIHYSGHGQPVPELPNAAEKEIDGLNQTIVPSDYISQQDGSNNIRNKEIKQWLIALKAKKPANVTLVFDTCYSGDITKGGRHLVRGARWRGPLPAKSSVVEAGAASDAAVQPKQKGPAGLLALDEAEGLGYVILGATLYTMPATETTDDSGDDMGLLTYAWTKALAQAAHDGDQTKRGTHTYRDLFDRVREIMAATSPEQTPVLEGAKDQVIFGGATIVPKSYAQIHVVGGALEIDEGLLIGVTVGSKYSVYPPETKSFDDKTSIAQVEVISVEMGSARIKLTPAFEGRIPNAHLELARAVESDHVFGSNALSIAIEGADDKASAELSEKLKSFHAVRAVVPSNQLWNLRIRGVNFLKLGGAQSVPTGADVPMWIVERDDGSMARSLIAGPALFGNLRELIEREARWRTLLNLTNRNGRSPVRIQFRPVPVTVLSSSGRVSRPEEIGADKPIHYDSRGQLALADGDFLIFEVRNNGTRYAWVTLLDLGNDGSVNGLFPTDACSSKNRIAPGKGWVRLPWCSVARVSNPSPRAEFYKAISTNEYVNLSRLFDSHTARGAPKDQGKLSSLAELIQAATLGEKGTENAAVNPEYWYTDVVPIVIGKSN
jgi:hypothetical protein